MLIKYNDVCIAPRPIGPEEKFLLQVDVASVFTTHRQLATMAQEELEGFTHGQIRNGDFMYGTDE